MGVCGCVVDVLVGAAESGEWDQEMCWRLCGETGNEAGAARRVISSSQSSRYGTVSYPHLA